MSLDPNLGFSLICKAIKNKNEEMLYNRWIHDYGAQAEGINFDKYMAQFKPYRKSTRTEKEEILKKYGGQLNGTV